MGMLKKCTTQTQKSMKKPTGFFYVGRSGQLVSYNNVNSKNDIENYPNTSQIKKTFFEEGYRLSNIKLQQLRTQQPYISKLHESTRGQKLVYVV